MNNDNAKIDNYLDNLKKELGINETETDTLPNTNACESEEPPTKAPVSVSEQPYQPEPADYETSASDNNTNVSTAQNIVNLFSGLTRCFNKRVQIPGCPEFVCTYFDSSYNAHLCVLNMQTNQPEYIANILLENSEFAVYQNGQRIGTLYGNDNEPVWQFIPYGMPVQNQNPQYIQPNMPNNPTYKYIFNNVPYEQATEIIDSVTKNKPSSNVEINFASPVADTQTHNDEIVLSTEQYSID